jgi:TRAP-type C4-dicarboxylate transport system permease small subunit
MAQRSAGASDRGAVPVAENALPPAGAAPPNLLDRFTDLVEAVALALFVFMMVATLLQVAGRYLEVSMDWTEELARILFLAAMMLGIAVAIRRREHIVVDVVYAKVPLHARAALAAVFDLGILLLLATWLRGAWRLMQLNAGTSFVMLPWVEVSYLYAVEVAAIVLMIVFVVADIVRRARLLSKAPAS